MTVVTALALFGISLFLFVSLFNRPELIIFSAGVDGDADGDGITDLMDTCPGSIGSVDESGCSADDLGLVDAVGTSFSLNGMHVSSSASVHAQILSAEPSYTLMYLETDTAVPVGEVELTVSGLHPSTPYYLYRNGSQVPVELTSSGAGNVSFTQDISTMNEVKLQDFTSTIIVGGPNPCPTGWSCVTSGGLVTQATAPAGGSTTEQILIVDATEVILGDGSGGAADFIVERTGVAGAAVETSFGQANGATIRGGDIRGGSHCVQNSNNNNVTIENVVCTVNGGLGITHLFSKGARITNNTMIGKNQGIQILSTEGTAPGDTVVSGNTTTGAIGFGGNGLLIRNAHFIDFINNTATGHTTGHRMDSGSTDNTIAGDHYNNNALFGMVLTDGTMRLNVMNVELSGNASTAFTSSQAGPVPNDEIHLDGVTVVAGTVGFGVNLSNTGNVTLKNSTISNASAFGLSAVADQSPTNVTVTDTTIVGIGAGVGVSIQSGATVTLQGTDADKSSVSGFNTGVNCIINGGALSFGPRAESLGNGMDVNIASSCASVTNTPPTACLTVNDSTGGGFVCSQTTPLGGGVADADGDGIEDSIDLNPTVPSAEFSDGGPTTGEVVLGVTGEWTASLKGGAGDGVVIERIGASSTDVVVEMSTGLRATLTDVGDKVALGASDDTTGIDTTVEVLAANDSTMDFAFDYGTDKRIKNEQAVGCRKRFSKVTNGVEVEYLVKAGSNAMTAVEVQTLDPGQAFTTKAVAMLKQQGEKIKFVDWCPTGVASSCATDHGVEVTRVNGSASEATPVVFDFGGTANDGTERLKAYATYDASSQEVTFSAPVGSGAEAYVLKLLASNNDSIQLDYKIANEVRIKNSSPSRGAVEAAGLMVPEGGVAVLKSSTNGSELSSVGTETVNAMYTSCSGETTYRKTASGTVLEVHSGTSKAMQMTLDSGQSTHVAPAGTPWSIANQSSSKQLLVRTLELKPGDAAEFNTSASGHISAENRSTQSMLVADTSLAAGARADIIWTQSPRAMELLDSSIGETFTSVSWLKQNDKIEARLSGNSYEKENIGPATVLNIRANGPWNVVSEDTAMNSLKVTSKSATDYSLIMSDSLQPGQKDRITLDMAAFSIASVGADEIKQTNLSSQMMQPIVMELAPAGSAWLRLDASGLPEMAQAPTDRDMRVVKVDLEPSMTYTAERTNSLLMTADTSNTGQMNTRVEIQSPEKKEFRIPLPPGDCYILMASYSLSNTMDVKPCSSNDGNTPVYDNGNQIDDLAPGTPSYGVGAATRETIEVTLHTIDRTGSVCPNGAGSCKGSIAGAEVRVFDRNNPQFEAMWTSSPDGLLYGDVYETAVGLVARCVTGADGRCETGENDNIPLLKIVKTSIDGYTVYTGLPQNPGAAQANPVTFLDVIRAIDKDGNVTIRAGKKTVVEGSYLEIIEPDYVIWENEVELYPFLFTSDSEWNIDLCLHVPAGYAVHEGECQQLLVANETATLMLTVEDMESPEPNFSLEIKLKHKDKTTNLNREVKGKRVTQGQDEKRPGQGNAFGRLRQAGNSSGGGLFCRWTGLFCGR